VAQKNLGHLILMSAMYMQNTKQIHASICTYYRVQWCCCNGSHLWNCHI